jgi:hypothetical protein
MRKLRMSNVIVIRADFAKQLLKLNHKLIDLMPKRYKNSSKIDPTRCIFIFLDDKTISQDLEKLKIESENNKSKSQ